jgi:hypothetical protein
MKFGEKRETPSFLPTTDQLVEQVEQGREKEPTRERAAASETTDAAAAQQANAAPAAATAAAPAAVSKDQYHVRIERILEENLVEVYLSLPPAARVKFKIEGEAAALKIRALIEQAKLRAKEVLKVILAWLKSIPRVNGYFLQQEAKIKTDKIVLLAQERAKEKEGQVS